MTIPRILMFTLGATLITAAGARAEPPKAAVFDFQLANLGIQGPTDEDKAPLEAVERACCARC